ncbi:EscU/YscU/HrcU family type III secretion system export apparatus switch protein [Notoacmeibacter ruber]|uniref:Flagellar biosynthesis protein FlhB n=1 Tax=Notoacmeibacter ruber TaxID=2670375 RepID=A0A3L7JDQ7_9HYPH|nr:flagellar type III secretion system protein FlhB [Notoacmeibacter ruber]RLQ88813.1 flagellar biosynthesis protein FlhB [Notoacmeibacter ruber]
MSEQDKDSKTEDPTEKRIRDALEKGQTAVSRETTLAVSLGVIMLWLLLIAEGSIGSFATDLAYIVDNSAGVPIGTAEDLRRLIWHVMPLIASLILPLFLLLMVAGIGASVIQNAPRAVLQRIRPKWSSISPVKGWTKIFGKKGLIEFAKSVAKFSFAALLLSVLLRSRLTELPTYLNLDVMMSLSGLGQTAKMLVAYLFIFMLIIGVIDFAVSKTMWKADLRMTKQEVKEEHKQAEGDPLVKSRIRAVARARARSRMMAAVPEATLVVANPTHFAVALRYNPEKDPAPRVIAKGTDEVALRIRRVAEEAGVPVFEDVPLARSLYRVAPLDSLIPTEFYRAVAALIRSVQKTGSAHAAY